MALDAPPKPTSFIQKLPYEVTAMILRYVVNDVLEVLRKDSKQPYSGRLQRYLHIRLVSKSIDEILSHLTFEGRPLDALLRDKQLEKLDHALETISAFSLNYATASLMSVSRMKLLCGRFWYNPDLSADAVKTMFALSPGRNRLNFATKLEKWINNHRERSEAASLSRDGIFYFERGDWVVNAGDLQIRRLSHWMPKGRKRIAKYLTYEGGLPMTDVHLRLGNERKWFVEFETPGGDGFMCLVNFSRGMVWDHTNQHLLTFDGRPIVFEDDDEDEEEFVDEEMA